MTCCSAINCKNRTEKGFRMYRFPRLNDKRYDKWLHNMRRGGNWKPSAHSRLCEKHFEKSQFESHRADGLIKLKPNAIPTLFDIPNPPQKLDPLPRKSVYKNILVKTPPKRVKKKSQKSKVTAKKLTPEVYLTEMIKDSSEKSLMPVNSTELEDLQEMKTTVLSSVGEKNRKLLEKVTFAQNAEMLVLQKENEELRAEVAKLQNALKSICSADQLKMLIDQHVL